jgi:ATP-dependent Zn protease
VSDPQSPTGLQWPYHGIPTPPPQHEAAKRDEPETRKPMPMWDRAKFLLLFALLFIFFVWSERSSNPLMSWNDALHRTLETKRWLLALTGIEVIRQVHYLVSERSGAYHAFWTRSVFGRFEQRAAKMNDWNRYRIARVLKILLFVFLLSVVLGAALHTSAVTALFLLPAKLFIALPFILQIAFSFFFVMFQFIGLFWFLSKGGVDTYFPDDIKTRFSDVWGQDAVVDRVKENMLFLEAPETIEEHGGYVPGGILLWGPPGTGKTLMAEAVAGETGKPFVFVDPGAFINMFMGVGILKVKGLFRKLRKLAVRYGGVIVFFDEADALGNRGALTGGFQGIDEGLSPWSSHPMCNGMSYLSSTAQTALLLDSLPSMTIEPPRRMVDRVIMGMGGMGGGGGTLQALLTELSGLKKPRGFLNRVVRRTIGMRPKPPPKYRILVMMATNMPGALDEALLRPGRIDRIYKVGYPSKEGRTRTYEGYLAKVSHSLTAAEVDKLATMTPYATGATIKDLVNEGLIIAIRDGRSSIEWRDILRAKQLKEYGLPDDAEYVDRERYATAIHEACHAVTAYRMRKHMVIDMASIERRGDIGGMVASVPPEDIMFTWKSELEADLMTGLASLAGERLFFGGDNSSGVGGDLGSATVLAIRMEGYWGMGSTVASHGVQRELGVQGGPSKKPGDKEDEMLEGPLGSRIERNLTRLLQEAKALLTRDRMMVFAVTHALVAHKSISGEDVTAIMEGTSGPLVDGRLYHTEQFAAAAEAYHKRAVVAHNDHVPIDMALPFSPVRQPALVGAPVGAAGNGTNGGPGGGNGTGGNGNGAPPPMFIPPLPPSGTPYTPPGALYPPHPPEAGGGNGGDGGENGDGGGLPPLS